MESQERPDETPQPLGIGLGAVLSLAAAAVLSRLLFFWQWNIKPVGGLCLFVGARYRSPWAFLVPLGVMIVSDLLLIYPYYVMGFSAIDWGTPFVYLAFVINVYLGRLLINSRSPLLFAIVSLIASLQFFVVSNFGVWLGGAGVRYPYTWAGLTECYTLALPFLRFTTISDLATTLTLLTLHGAYLALAIHQHQKASEPA